MIHILALLLIFVLLVILVKMRLTKSVILQIKGERSSEFYETFFELEGVRGEEKGAFLEQNISLALFYNVKLKNHQKKLQKLFI